LGHVAQLVSAWVPSSNWPTDQFQGTKPVRLQVRPATEGTQPHHRRETFLYTLKAGPAGGRLRRPSSTGNPTAAGAGRLNASALRRSARRATEYPVDNDAGLLMESAT
jgi:hypothetical protein